MEERSWWSRLRARVRGWLRLPAAEGRWRDGHGFSWHGVVYFRPWVFPRRHFRLYVPRGWSKSRPAPLVVLIHGCRQTADEFARGTRIAAAADDAGALVLMPDQKDGANPYRCWNWFDARTVAGKGEAAIIAAMITKVTRQRGADPDRVLVAGLSAGAALAAVLGVRFPRLVHAVFAHSGLACGAAASAFTALTVMRRGPDADVGQIAAVARREAGAAVHVPITIVQGRDDDVVARLNAEALARQYLVLNGVDVPAGANSTLPPADRSEHLMPAADRVVHTREWVHEKRTVVRLVEVDGLAHGWSGGDATLPFHDAAPPDATAMLAQWVGVLAR